jgi:CheY-like chemotaxis protein
LAIDRHIEIGTRAGNLFFLIVAQSNRIRSRQISYALYHTDDLSPIRLNRCKINVRGKRVAELRPVAKGIVVPRVLVVDDDPMVCVAIELCLTRQGFEVTVADGGEAGMRALESSRFDVMLIDVFMPHMRGFESIRMFHERMPDVPIVAMSGYAFANTERAPDFLRMTIELGAARCLRKPFTPDALLTTVNECLAKPTPSARASR